MCRGVTLAFTYYDGRKGGKSTRAKDYWSRIFTGPLGFFTAFSDLMLVATDPAGERGAENLDGSRGPGSPLPLPLPL